MKNYLALLLLAFVFTANAQTLQRFIPNNSNIVVEVSGDNIFSLIDLEEVKSMLPPEPGSETGEPMNPEDLGFDLKTKAYYFNQIVDSITYNNFLFKVNDATKVETFILDQFPMPPMEMNGYKVIVEPTMTIAWNSEMVCLSNATVPQKKYTMDDLLAEKEMEEENDEDRRTDEDMYDEEEDEYNDEWTEEEDLEFELMMKNMGAPFIYSEEELLPMMKAHFSNLVSLDPSMSLSQSESFTSGRDVNSSAYFWIRNMDDLLSNFMPAEMPGDFPTSFNPSMMLGYESIAGNLIFGKDEIRVDATMEMKDDLAAIFQKMYKKPVNNAIHRYFDGNDVLAFMNYEIDATNALKEYPDLIDNMYGNMFPAYQEEIDIATDLVAIFLDEDAIGQLFTGSMMMVLHDVEEKEVKYTTYEYDEDYNATEVEQTKMEPLPIFTMMMGSENEKFFDKVIKLAAKYEMLESAKDFSRITLESQGLPFDLFFSHHDGIVFLTNSEGRMQKSLKPGAMNKAGKLQQMIANNMFNFYMNIEEGMKKMSSLLPMDGPQAAYAESFKEVIISAGEMKGKKVGMDFVITTNGEQDNALQTILDMFKQ